jgi:tetratricopeptide (TPR) repeat protein
MDNGRNTDYSVGNGSPPRGGAPIDCTVVRGMLGAGVQRLTEEALQDLANHLDTCHACSATVDTLCPEAPAGDNLSTTDHTQTPEPEGLLSRLVREVVDEYEHQKSHRDIGPAIATQIAEPYRFLLPLKEAIALRQIAIATTLVLRHFDAIVEIDPLHENAAATLGYFAQWMEMSGSAHRVLRPHSSCLALVGACLARFPRPPRPSLRLLDCAHLRMVEGFLSMHAEEYDGAIRNFSWILSPAVRDELGNGDLVAVAASAVAKAYSRKGAYKDALPYADDAIAIARESGWKELAAAIGVIKAWILFQLKKPTQAIEILHQSESVLLDTDDHLALGNIRAAFGRILRRDGRYPDALSFYRTAIDHYGQCDPDGQHPNLARALVNIAFLERLIALRNKNTNKSILLTDREKDSETSGQRVVQKDSVEKLRQMAFKHLARARKIYNALQDYRGRGSVLLISAFLHFDDGDLEGVASKLAEAYTLGKAKADCILMARARIQQCMLENAKAQAPCRHELIPSSHVEWARSFAKEAITLSENTQNPRLIAHSCIWSGITLLNDYSPDPWRARQCYQKAATLLNPAAGQDLVWDDLQALKRKLERAGHVGLFSPKTESVSSRVLHASGE